MIWEGETAEIATAWRATATSNLTWQRADNQAGVLGEVASGEAGGFFVRCTSYGGRRAYLKPLRKDERGWRRAAREKIASDLASEIEVPVPPVILIERSDCGSNEEKYTCLSLVIAPRQFSWGTVRPQAADPSSELGAFVAPVLGRSAAHGLAFDTWVGQTDHGDHPHNIVLGYDPDDLSKGGLFLFLDFSFSLGIGGGWDDGGYSRMGVAPFPSLMMERIDTAALEAMISSIEQVSDPTIDEIVRRIPSNYLPEPEQDVIVTGLKERKRMARGILAPALSGG